MNAPSAASARDLTGLGNSYAIEPTERLESCRVSDGALLTLASGGGTNGINVDRSTVQGDIRGNSLDGHCDTGSAVPCAELAPTRSESEIIIDCEAADARIPRARSHQVTRILIADDLPVIRLGARVLLERNPQNQIVGEVGTVELMNSFLESTPCDLLILSLQMRDGHRDSGTAVVARVRRRFPHVRVIYFPDTCSLQTMRSVLSLGAIGVVLKSSAKRQLQLAVRSAKKGIPFIANDLSEAIVDCATSASLTPAEETVLQLIADGYKGSEIAAALGKSSATISAQKKSAMRKLGLGSTAALYSHLSSWRSKPVAPPGS